MSTHHLSPDAAAARERHRSVNGRFGTQSRTEAEIDLAPESMLGRVDRIGAEADQLLDRSREIEASRAQVVAQLNSTQDTITTSIHDHAAAVDCPHYLALRMADRVFSRGTAGITAVGKAGEARAAGKRLAEALKGDPSITEGLARLEQLRERESDLGAQASEFRSSSLHAARTSVHQHNQLAGRVEHYRSAAAQASAQAADHAAVTAQGGTGQITEISVLAPGALREKVRRTPEGTNLYTSWSAGEPLQRVLDIEVEQAAGATTVRYRYADGSTRQVGVRYAQGRTERLGPTRAVVDTGAAEGEAVTSLSGVLDSTD